MASLENREGNKTDSPLGCEDKSLREKPRAFHRKGKGRTKPEKTTQNKTTHF